MGYLRRQLITSALVANAIRPAPGPVASIPSMFAGWFVSELAPHFIVGTAVDTALELGHRHHRRTPLLGLANIAALTYVLGQSRVSHQTFDSALVEGLGSDYRERLEKTYDDLDLPTPVKQLVWPFRIPNEGIEVIRDVPYAPQFGKRG